MGVTRKEIDLNKAFDRHFDPADMMQRLEPRASSVMKRDPHLQSRFRSWAKASVSLGRDEKFADLKVEEADGPR